MKNKIKQLQRMTALFLSALLVSSLLYPPAFAVGVNDDGVFIKQATNTTCTLASATMMLRRHAILDGVSDWNAITESAVRPTAWSGGLRFSFSYRGMSVATQSIISAGYTTVSAKRDYFISMLRSHPEGIVIYAHSVPNRSPHAVLLTDYDGGTFYCADPAGSSRGRVPMANTTLPGSGQDGKLENIKQIWYIKSGTATGGTSQPAHTTHTKGDYMGMMGEHPHQSCYKCTVCGATYADQTSSNIKSSCAECRAAHTPHTWDGGKVTKEATFDSTGTKTYTCTVCGETKTETVDRLESMTFRCKDGGAQLLLTRDGHLRVTDENGIIGYVDEDGGCDNRLKQAEWNGLQMVDYVDLVTSISFGEGITTLDSYCDFDIFPNLTTVELPQSLTTINNCAFAFCRSLQEISLPKNVSSLGGNAFQDCESLKKITISDQNPNYCSVDNIVYTKDMTKLIFCAPARNGDVVIPDGVNEINFYAFGSCDKLNSVTIPKSITSIDSGAFLYDRNIHHKFNATLRIYAGSYAETYIKEFPEYLSSKIKWTIIDECANGHTWDNGQITTQATTSSEGVRTYTCTVCKTTRTEMIPALPAPTQPTTPTTPTTTTPTSGSLQNFTASKVYYSGLFRDVPANMWYSGNVAAVYQLGLMNGTGASTFAPKSNVTIAEAVTLAARLHSIYYTGKEMFENYDGGNWYDPYVNYARDNGIISENYNFGLPATRETFAHILAQALPVAALLPVRSETIRFADAGSIVYAGDVNLLCQAGVINGEESGGVVNFLPRNTITRAEAAAIVTRMAQPGLRAS